MESFVVVLLQLDDSVTCEESLQLNIYQCDLEQVFLIAARCRAPLSRRFACLSTADLQ